MNLNGLNMGRVKHQNRTAVLKYINQEGAVSRKDISLATGLTAASVTQIVNNFIDDGILRELGTREENTGVGRKQVLVDINFDYAFVWNISIELEHTTLTLTNLRGAVLAQQIAESAAGSDPEDYLLKLAELCNKMTELQTKSVIKRIHAVSVGIPGLVDRESGTSLHAYGIWEVSVPIREILQRAMLLPCYVENNVNAFALATLYYGEGRKYDNLHIIKWGPGVGSALIIDGRIYEGRKGKAAELGHFIVEKDGRKCNCGRYGCLETKVSFYALNQVMEFDRDEFGAAYDHADEAIREELDRAIDLFARSIVNSMTIMAPNRVILCGFMVKDPPIRRKLIAACQHYDSGINETRLLHSMLSDKADWIGPVATYMHEIFFNDSHCPNMNE